MSVIKITTRLYLTVYAALTARRLRPAEINAPFGTLINESKFVELIREKWKAD